MTRIYSLAAALVTALTIGAVATPVGAQAAQSQAYDP